MNATNKKKPEREREKKSERKGNNETEKGREKKNLSIISPPIEDVGTGAIICLKLPPSSTGAGIDISHNI